MEEQQFTTDYQLTKQQKEMLDERYDNHQKGIGATYSWEETVAIMEKALNQQKNSTNL